MLQERQTTRAGPGMRPLVFSLNQDQDRVIRRLAREHGHSLSQIVDHALGAYILHHYGVAWKPCPRPPADGRSQRQQTWLPGRRKPKLVLLTADQWDALYQVLEQRGAEQEGQYSLLVDQALGYWIPMRYHMRWPHQDRLAREGTQSRNKTRAR